MDFAKIKKPLILGILFFLPVTFLLFLYPSTHNYNSLDIVYESVEDITGILPAESKESDLADNISVVLFLGKHPMANATAALNLKEMIYDKFKGFKKFQVLALVHESGSEEVKDLEKELYQYDELTYWEFVMAEEDEIRDLFNSLLNTGELSADLFYPKAFIIDKELKQRGRIDDRTKTEIEKNAAPYGLYAYNCVEVSELKDKMSEDMRILFTEYRQRRKGNFNSSTRRVDDLKTDEEN